MACRLFRITQTIRYCLLQQYFQVVRSLSSSGFHQSYNNFAEQCCCDATSRTKRFQQPLFPFYQKQGYRQLPERYLPATVFPSLSIFQNCCFKLNPAPTFMLILFMNQSINEICNWCSFRRSSAIEQCFLQSSVSCIENNLWQLLFLRLALTIGGQGFTPCTCFVITEVISKGCFINNWYNLQERSPLLLHWLRMLPRPSFSRWDGWQGIYPRKGTPSGFSDLPFIFRVAPSD